MSPTMRGVHSMDLNGSLNIRVVIVSGHILSVRLWYGHEVLLIKQELVFVESAKVNVWEKVSSSLNDVQSISILLIIE
jgi:hypothetical protein